MSWIEGIRLLCPALCECARTLAVENFDSIDKQQLISKMAHQEIVKLLQENDLKVHDERVVYEFVKEYLQFRRNCPELEPVA